MRCWIVLLNWNGWRDTVECLESVLRLDTPHTGIVVCDNASDDDSWQRLQQWAQGRQPSPATAPTLASLTTPARPKPIAFCTLSRAQAESESVDHTTPLVLIQTGANLGFAGGNNVGLRYALRDRSCQYFWLLNNDTVVRPQALAALLEHMQQHPRVGLCGSLTYSYATPHEVQARGGHRYNRWTGRVSSATQTRFDYVNGASMLASRAFLETVGLLDESYFLYFEELDWAMRSRGRFALGYAPASVIYHKQGTATGGYRNRHRRSLMADMYLTRNRIFFTRRYFPRQLPTVLLAAAAAAGYRLLLGDSRRARAMLQAIVHGLAR